MEQGGQTQEVVGGLEGEVVLQPMVEVEVQEVEEEQGGLQEQEVELGLGALLVQQPVSLSPRPVSSAVPGLLMRVHSAQAVALCLIAHSLRQEHAPCC